MEHYLLTDKSVGRNHIKESLEKNNNSTADPQEMQNETEALFVLLFLKASQRHQVMKVEDAHIDYPDSLEV